MVSSIVKELFGASRTKSSLPIYNWVLKLDCHGKSLLAYWESTAFCEFVLVVKKMNSSDEQFAFLQLHKQEHVGLG